MGTVGSDDQIKLEMPVMKTSKPPIMTKQDLLNVFDLITVCISIIATCCLVLILLYWYGLGVVYVWSKSVTAALFLAMWPVLLISMGVQEAIRSYRRWSEDHAVDAWKGDEREKERNSDDYYELS